MSRRIGAYSKIYGTRLEPLLTGRYRTVEELLESILEADPTKSKYFEWLIKQYIAGLFIVGEDNARIRGELSLYSKNLARFDLKDRDINRFNYDDLKVFLDEKFGDGRGGIEEAPISSGEDVRVIADSLIGTLSTPLTDKGSILLSSGTKWCTSGILMFKAYNEQGPLYIFKDKQRGGDKFQFHFESGSFMDSRDTKIKRPLLDHYRKDNIVTSPLFKLYEEKFIEEGKAKELYNYYTIIGDEDILNSLKLMPRGIVLLSIKNGMEITPEMEDIIATDAEASYSYSKNIIKERWPQGEESIATSGLYSLLYSLYVLNSRFYRGERAILDNPLLEVEPSLMSFYTRNLRSMHTYGQVIEFQDDVYKTDFTVGIVYASSFMKGERWRELEPLIIHYPIYLASYAIDCMERRFFEVEDSIASNAQAAVIYADNFDMESNSPYLTPIGDKDNHYFGPMILKSPRSRWYEAEETILVDPILSLDYIINNIRDRWPEFESRLLSGEYTNIPPVINYMKEKIVEGYMSYTQHYASECPIIIDRTAMLAYVYADSIIRGRWPEAEHLILRDPYAAAAYSSTVMRRRWPEAMSIVLRSPLATDIYNRIRPGRL